MTRTELNRTILSFAHLDYATIQLELSKLGETLSPNAIRKTYRRLKDKLGLPGKGDIRNVYDTYALVEAYDKAEALGSVYQPTVNQKPVETPEDRIRRYKAEMLEKQVKAAEKSEEMEQARHEMLLETISDALTPITLVGEPLSPDKIPTARGTEEAAVLVLSDLHFGKKTSKYNMAIAEQRFNQIIDGFIKIISLHRKAYPVNELHIFMTGDIVDGDSIYPTHPHHMDTHVVNQIFKTLGFVAKRFAQLSQIFDRVHVHSIRGNHGRISKFAHETANFDYLYALALEQACSSIPNITFNSPEGWYQVVDVLGTRILQYHGHQIKMTMNLPWYGITTRLSRWASSESVGHFDVAVQGHFHASSRIRWNDKKLFTNGTLVAGDEFALEFMGLESSECQWCFGIHPENGVTWQYELFAD